MVINTLYLDNGILKSANSLYNRQYPKNIRLENFFQTPVFLLLQKKLYNVKYKLKFHPYRHKYLTSKLREVNSFVNGHYFDIIVREITGIKNYKVKYEIRKFYHENYTLLHDAEKEKQNIDFVLDFSKSGRYYGGYTIYLTESKELLQLNPAPNTFSFVRRNKGLMKYTKYVSHQQEHPIIQVVGTIVKK